MSGYVQRQVNLTVQLGQGNFGTSGFNTIELTGLRVSATIEHVGLPDSSTASVQVYGLDLSTMNQLSTLGKPMIYDRQNLISVTAGDAVNGMSLVYTGTIARGIVDLNRAPEAAFIFTAFFGKEDATRPVPPISYKGTADAATILSGIATQLGYAFENNGVSVQLSNPYFPGTALDQISAVARAANIVAYRDPQNRTLAIWPKNGFRNSGSVPLVSASTGMIGYPAYEDFFINVRSLYNPNIVFGRQVQIESSITPACGRWNVSKLTHNLESQTPNGEWFTEFQAWRMPQS